MNRRATMSKDAVKELNINLMSSQAMLGADNAVLSLQLCSRNSMPKGAQVEEYGFWKVKGRQLYLILGQKQLWLMSWPSHAGF